MNLEEFLHSVSEKFTPGKWVAIVGEDYVEGDDHKEVYDQMMKKYPEAEIFLMKVPRGGPRCP